MPLTTGGVPYDFEAEEKSTTTRNVKAVVPTKHGRVSTDGSVEERLAEVYYSPEGYWMGLAAIPKLAIETGVCEDVAHEWLTKQAIWQIYLPAPARSAISRPKFDISTPNEVHQADLLFLPHDRVGRHTLKYALTVVDVASRYKEAQAITDKTATQVGKALESIYARGPLRWPKVLQVDPGSEFREAVQSDLMG